MTSAPESSCILTLVSSKLTSVYLRLALRSPSIFLILGCLVGPLLLWQSFCGQSFFRWNKDPQRKQAPLVEARGFSLLGRSCRFFFLWLPLGTAFTTWCVVSSTKSESFFRPMILSDPLTKSASVHPSCFSSFDNNLVLISSGQRGFVNMR